MSIKGILGLVVGLSLVGCRLGTGPQTVVYDAGTIEVAYTCEASCIPVRFEVEIPLLDKRRPDIYLSGNFNDWVHGDRGLRFHHEQGWIRHTLHRLTSEEATRASYWIEVMLPDGADIEYRYVIDEVKNVGFAEQNQQRRLPIATGQVQRDTVQAWVRTPIRDGAWTAERLTYDQQEFLRTRMQAQFFVPETTREVDSLMAMGEAFWKKEGLRAFPGFPHLLSETYGMLYHEERRRMNVRTDEVLDCHVMDAHMLPAFEREFATVTHEYDRHKFRLLADFGQLMDAVYCTTLSDATWNRLESLYFEEIPGLLEQYEQSGGSQVDERVAFFRNYMMRMEREYTFRRTLNDGEWATADQVMRAALFDTTGNTATISQQASRLQYMPPRLIEGYADSGNLDAALDVVDLVLQNTSTLVMPSDTLRRWYTDIAGIEGLRRFEKLLNETDRDRMQGSGDPIPLVGTVTNLTDGSTFDLASLQGKTVVIDFWTTWCPPCIAEIPELVTFHERIEDRADLVFVSVSMDETSSIKMPREELMRMIESQKIRYPVLFDDPENPISSHFTVNYFPTKYVLDEGGRLVTEISSVLNVPLD